jgi:hypothetical protein
MTLDRNPHESWFLNQLDRQGAPTRSPSGRSVSDHPRHLSAGKLLRQRLSAKSINVVLVLDPAQVAALPAQGSHVALVIEVAGRQVKATLNGKTTRRVITAITTHGSDGVVVILHGKLGRGDVLENADVTAQLKNRATAAAPAAAAAGEAAEDPGFRARLTKLRRA